MTGAVLSGTSRPPSCQECLSAPSSIGSGNKGGTGTREGGARTLDAHSLKSPTDEAFLKCDPLPTVDISRWCVMVPAFGGTGGTGSVEKSSGTCASGSPAYVLMNRCCISRAGALVLLSIFCRRVVSQLMKVAISTAALLLSKISLILTSLHCALSQSITLISAALLCEALQLSH